MMSLTPLPLPTTTTSIGPTSGTIGAHNDGTKNVEDCIVTLAGDLGRLGTARASYTDLVQVFDFDDFATPTTTTAANDDDDDDTGVSAATPCNNASATTTQSLREFMIRSKDKLDCLDQEISDPVLRDIHERFLPIVQDIIGNKGLYASRLQGADFSLAMTGTAQARHASDQFACYLHNDIWMKGGGEEAETTKHDDSDNHGSRQEHGCNPPPSPRLLNHRVALVNIWFVLNGTPPQSNTLVFYETAADKTRQAHMLHGRVDDVQDCTVVYDENMCWGRFYLFVSGQVDTCERILLHGALNMEPTPSDISSSPTETRRSVEMRYNVYI